MQCPRCQQDNPSHAKFCLGCGAAVDRAVVAAGSHADLKAEVARLKGEIEGLRRSLSEALEQQTATSEILRVISQSPTDVQPVMKAIVESAVRLADADNALIGRAEGDHIRWLAVAGTLPELPHVSGQPISRSLPSGRAIIDGQTTQVEDISVYGNEFPGVAAAYRQLGVRTILATPLLREGNSIGVILVRRTTVRPFTDQQIALLKTFANQAVIAIENVRLFTETKEALDRQTATAEILRVISSSPTDVQPVFETIVRNASMVCGAFDAAIFIRDRDQIYLAAHQGPIQAHTIGTLFGLSAVTVAGHAILGARPIHVDDLSTAADYPEGRTYADQFGYRTTLAVPLVARGAAAVGALLIRRNEVRPFSDQQVALLQTFADQAVIAIENVRLFKELESRNRDLTDALEQQTASGEILRVISSSPTDVTPVFDAICRSAVRLLGAHQGGVFRFDGKLVHIAALTSLSPEAEGRLRKRFPQAPNPHAGSGRAIVEKRVFQIPDTEEFPSEGQRATARDFGFRRSVWVPMIRDEQVIGVLSVNGREPGPYSEREIELLKTFADQAVIAIENVRLFTELEARNRDLTATGEILQVISRSPTDTQPVFDKIAERAVSLCGAAFGAVFRFDDGWINIAALTGLRPDEVEAARRYFPRRVTPGGLGVSHVALTGEVAHIPDVQADPAWRASASGPAFSGEGFRTCLLVPLNREGLRLGAINVWRREAAPFSDQHIELLKSFADQAVIAIENVRLFNELQSSNRELTAALDQQTATSEILRVIASSPGDIQPVFDAIAANAARLCEAVNGLVIRFDGELLHLAAHYNVDPERLAALRQSYPRPPSRGALAGRAILMRDVIHVRDVSQDAEYTLPTATTIGYRSVLAVPMMHEGVPRGTILVAREVMAPFSDAHIALLQTFADQAVIAIENVRLFKELETRTRDLTRSVGELRALSDVGQAISSTLDLGTVLSTIAARATQLSGTDAGVIYEYDEQREVFVPRATEHLEPEIIQTMLATPVRKGEGATGRLAEVLGPVQVPDILAAPAESRVRGALVRSGYRALLAVPLVRENRLLGGLTVIRKAIGEFAPEVIELLQTFATQSALAIQNARLFREIADKSRQLEVASQHKSEFLANMSHELRTPLNAIIGFSEVLNDRMFGELNEKQDEYLKDIYASGTHLLSLINDILDLSKIEAGRMELELTDFDLPTALDNALMLVRERAQRRSLTLHKDVDAGVGQIQGDERKIRQVVLNLLSNAIKFTPEGGRIELAAVPKNGCVEVFVSDTGVGIEPEDHEKVFEEFRQVGTAEKKAEGTGLGLTLCRKFVELHGGKIWVKSQVGTGSTFTFTIPVGGTQ